MATTDKIKPNPETAAYLRDLGIEKMFADLTWNLYPMEGESFEDYRVRSTKHDALPDFMPRRTFYSLTHDLFLKRYEQRRSEQGVE